MNINCPDPNHSNQRIKHLCVDPECQKRRLLCLSCLQQINHERHQILEITQLNEYAIQTSQKCKGFIEQLTELITLIQEEIQELVITLTTKYQKTPKSSFNYEQLQSYLNIHLNYDIVQEKIYQKVCLYLKKVLSNIMDVKSNPKLDASSTQQQELIQAQQLGTQLLQNNFISEAQEIIQKTLLQDPNNLTTQILQGIHQYLNSRLIYHPILAQNQNIEAYSLFEGVFRIDPNNIQALNGLGDALRGRNNFSVALIFYEKTLEKNPCDRQALLGKAHCLGKVKKFQEAKMIYEHILNQNQNDIDALKSLADLLRIQSNDEEAIRLYDKILQLNKNHVESLSGKGDCYRSLGKFDDAMKCLQRAQELSPKHVLTLTRIGDCLRQQKKFSEAINYYSEALSIDPQEEWSQSKLNECIQKRQY